jgi:hypothetical protein
MEKVIMDILGWAGAALYLIAYGLVSAKKVESDSWLYQGINIIAGVMLIVFNMDISAYPSAGLNIAWVGIAIVTLGRKYWVRNA